uniref:Uncharacterized protein n=1 Tax=Anguilla anguilla TaxID=7936 RepID=A0A0E9VI77_ANGAN
MVNLQDPSQLAEPVPLLLASNSHPISNQECAVSFKKTHFFSQDPSSLG